MPKKIKKYKHGGPVDDIPAMLTEGEYVIKEKSARKLGYKNLDAMNETGEIPSYNAGGRVKKIKGYGDGGKVKVDVKKEVEQLKPKDENELKHYKKWREDKDWYEKGVVKDRERMIREWQKKQTRAGSKNLASKKKKGGDYA
jgi:hypothetical protein